MSCIIIKVSGSLLKKPYGEFLAADIASLVQRGHQVLIVHGGGPQLDEAIQQENREPQKIAGRRITSADDLKLAIRVWRGDISTSWVRLLYQHSVSSLALTGQDAQFIIAERRPTTKIRDAEDIEREVDFGFVGDIKKINKQVITTLWKANIVPIVAPLATSIDGTLLNINADTIATELSIVLQVDALCMMSNTDGILRNHKDPDSRIPNITTVQAKELLNNGTIRTGMRPKVEGIIYAIQKGVSNIYIADGRQESAISKLLIHNKSVGTHFS